MNAMHDRPLGEGRGLSRRSFLAAAAGTVAAPFILPASALGRDGFIAPSERINIGIIGMGDRGTSHLNAFLPRPDAQIVAVCDTFLSKAEAARTKANAAYAARTGAPSFSGCAALQDFREMLARPDVDAVIICAPENWHAWISLAALRAGKDVYCEKALALTVAEGQAVREAVHRGDRVLQCGTQQRSDRNFRFACELARNGYLGKVHTVQALVPGGRALPVLPVVPVPQDLAYDLWLGPAPWTPYRDGLCTYNWYFNTDYCAGWIQSWGVHHVDIALWGLPTLHATTLEVEGAAVFPTDGDGNVSYEWQTKLRSPDGVTLDFISNKLDTPYQEYVRFTGDKGWVHVSRSGIDTEPKSLLGVQLTPADEHLYVSLDHQANFLECIRRRTPPAAPVDACFRATAATLAADVATRLGRKVVWDWKTETFGQNDEANRYLRRVMREPWVI